MANKMKCDFYVEKVERRHLKNGDRLRSILEKEYDNGEHKDFVDYDGAVATVDMQLAPGQQREFPGMKESDEGGEE